MFKTHRYPKVRAGSGGAIIPPYDVTTWSLPLMMDVNAERVVLNPVDIQRLHPLTTSDWPDGNVEGKGQYYAVMRNANASAALLNDLIAKKANVSVAKNWFEVNKVSYPPGTLITESADVPALAAKNHVKVYALGQKPNIAAAKMREVRVGLYKPWLASMDEGWTRWLLEQYRFTYKSLDNKTLKAGKLNAAFDVILIPDLEKDIIVDGKPKRESGEMKYWEEMPPEYAGGIAKEGTSALKEFAENGGTIITMGESGDYLADEFNIPVRNTLATVKGDDFNCPGSLLKIELDPMSPVNYGMPKEAKAFVDGSIAYQTTIPGGGIERSVIAKYPADAEDVLVSGYIKGAERLENRAAAVSFTYGKGRLILLGFRPQHRAQTEGTFKMLFNSIFWAGMEEAGKVATATAQAGT
jgi:hypothetical protein